MLATGLLPLRLQPTPVASIPIRVADTLNAEIEGWKRQATSDEETIWALRDENTALRTRLARTEQLLATARRVVSRLIVRGIAKDAEVAALRDRLARAEARERKLREALEYIVPIACEAQRSVSSRTYRELWRIERRANRALSAPTDGAAPPRHDEGETA
jgi:septal ring factor EnvC (AmiA/AmiB activator)